MAESQRALAKRFGLSKTTVLNIMQEFTEEEDVINECERRAKLLKEQREMPLNSAEFGNGVRRIDEKETSSMRDLLQDCKERYVKNEMLINRLQYEIDNSESLMAGTKSGNLQVIPPLTAMEKYIKVNISLRRQIAELEGSLEINAESKEDDPFE